MRLFFPDQAASKAMLQKAEQLGLDLKTKSGHYKRLKALAKEEVKAYFQLLSGKKAAHDPKEEKRKKKKKEAKEVVS